MFEICYCFQVRKLRRREFSRTHPLSAAFVTSFKLGSSDEGNFHELTHSLQHLLTAFKLGSSDEGNFHDLTHCLQHLLLLSS